jgi:hypothetical protein
VSVRRRAAWAMKAASGFGVEPTTCTRRLRRTVSVVIGFLGTALVRAYIATPSAGPPPLIGTSAQASIASRASERESPAIVPSTTADTGPPDTTVYRDHHTGSRDPPNRNHCFRFSLDVEGGRRGRSRRGHGVRGHCAAARSENRRRCSRARPRAGAAPPASSAQRGPARIASVTRFTSQTSHIFNQQCARHLPRAARLVSCAPWPVRVRRRHHPRGGTRTAKTTGTSEGCH